MPTLVRFLTALIVLAAIAGGIVFALAFLVEPNTREMTIRIPASKLEPKP
jgi:hypothetical protein